MRRVIGILFLMGALALTFHFAVWGTAHADAAPTADASAPFLSLGRNYPKDALTLVGAAWCLVAGLALLLRSDASQGGTIAFFHLLNGRLLVSMLFTAYVGAKGGAETKLVGVFFLTAVAQAALGLLLMIFACFEKPKGIGKLIVGSAVYLFGVVMTVMVFVWGAPK